MHVDRDLHHPALVEMVVVARELVKEEDEELARETLPTFNENLIKLQQLVATSQLKSHSKFHKKSRHHLEDPQGAAAKMISDMRANVCAGNPDLHADKCDAFMKQYCAENAGSDACAAFYGKPKEEKPKPTPKPAPVKKAEPKPVKKPSQQDVQGLPSQGFDGEEVAHVDGETSTDDWRREFGPGQPDTYDSVCSKHPDNEWCRLNGYGGLYHGSSERLSTFSATALALTIFGTFW